MSDIDFLDKNPGEEQKPKSKVKNKSKPVWSEPGKKAAAGGVSAFAFLPFFGKKKEKAKTAAAETQAPIDKNKIRRSRREILELIKMSESEASGAERKAGKNLFAGLKERLAGRPNHKEVMVDYQKVFNQERVKRNSGAPAGQSGRIVETAPEKREEEDGPGKTPETNLIRGEIITFFDWRKRIMILAAVILAAVFFVGAVHSGLLYYQKRNQNKNFEQTKKFEEITEEIRRESSGLKEISDFQKRLETVSQIFARHVYWTNFFKFLEDNTIKNVHYMGFSGDTGGGYSLEALASKFSDISEQVNVLKNNEKTVSAQAWGGELVSGDEKNKAKVKFTLDFSILKAIFTE